MTVTKGHITRRASEDTVPAKTVERDYVLAHAVTAIASHRGQSKLVLKGGASLRLIHFEDYRYSADLDFSVVEGTKEEGLELIRAALERPWDGAISEIRLTEDDPLEEPQRFRAGRRFWEAQPRWATPGAR